MVNFVVINSCETKSIFEGNYFLPKIETDHGLYISNNVEPCIFTGCRTTCAICREKMAEKFFTKQYEPGDFNKFFPRTHYAKLKPYLIDMVQIIGICEECKNVDV